MEAYDIVGEALDIFNDVRARGRHDLDDYNVVEAACRVAAREDALIDMYGV